MSSSQLGTAVYKSMVTRNHYLQIKGHLRYQSEKTDKKIIESKVPDKHNPEVEKVKRHDKKVALSELIVWINPLNATQKYTKG